MRRLMLSLAMLSLTTSLRAQISADKLEQTAIRRAKNVMVSTLDRRLPRVTLQFFLDYEAEGASIHWEMNDCGEQSGSPALDQGRDIPICVEADFDTKDKLSTAILLSVGTSQKGLATRAELFSVAITDPSGQIHPLQKLGDLPMQLRRPMPKTPRDTPVPVG